jgi:hypothetical protein
MIGMSDDKVVVSKRENIRISKTLRKFSKRGQDKKFVWESDIFI